MVRTAFYFGIGLFSVLAFNIGVFAQDMESRVARLEMRASPSSSVKCQPTNRSVVASTLSTNQYSQCARFFGTSEPERFRFSEKREGFSLQYIKNFSSLVHQGGSRLYQAGHTIPLLSDVLTAGIEMVYRDPFLTTNSTSSTTTQMGTQLVLKGSMKTMSYRAEYGYTGQDTGKVVSSNPHDRVGGKFLWEWELPFVTPKVELSRFANNVAQAPTSNQTISTRQHYSIDWTIPDWPNLTVTYDQEQKDMFNRSEGNPSDASVMEKISTKISFERPIAKSEWSTRYVTFQNNIHDQGTLEELHSTLKGTLHLIQPVDISPSIGFTQYTNAKQGFSQERILANLGTTFRFSTEQTLQPSIEWTRITSKRQASLSDTLMSKLQYTYHPLDHGYHISVIGQYVLNQTSQLSSHPQTYDISVFVRKDLHALLGLPHQQQFISVKLSHNQQVNTLSFQTQRRSSTAMVLLSVMP